MKTKKRSLVIDLNRPRQRALVIFFLVAGVIELGLLVFGGLETLEFTDTSAFCGSLCHQVMNPELTAYENSPHAQVPCTECHVGSGTNYLVRTKATGLRLVFATLFNTYSRPIETPINNLRPARETCQHCHWPEKFTEDRVRIYDRYNSDEANSRERRVLVFRMLGNVPGSRGVHWHIASKVWYLNLDEKRHEIVWVAAEEPDGSTTEWVDPDRLGDFTQEQADKDRRFFDCIDCHNRATHIFRSPEELIDDAIIRGDIDPALPFIRREGLKILDPSSPSVEDAQARADALLAADSVFFPGGDRSKQAELEKAVETLKLLAEQVVFPHMKVTSDTHFNNLTHDGCFRCHGKLVADKADGSTETLNASCTLCHFELESDVIEAVFGEVTKQTEPAPSIPHETKGREQCLVCHETGVGTATRIPDDHVGRPVTTCQTCHDVAPVAGPAATATPVPSGTPAPTAAPAPTALPTITLGLPQIPHTLEGRADCLLCHSTNIPDDHEGRAGATCTVCHKLAPDIAPPPTLAPTGVVPSPTPSPVSTATPVATATPAPTAAPGATPAPTATATPGPAPTPTPAPTNTPVPTATPEPETEGPDSIPHTLDGRDQCLVCHESGVLGATKVPDNHARRTNDQCTLCHAPE